MAHRLITKLTTRDHRLSQFHHFEILVNVFVVILLISNLVGQKIVDLGTLNLGLFTFTIRLSGAQVLFPITYIFGDIFTEVYGYAGSRRAIWVGFFSSALMALIGLLIVWLPPSPDWHNQAAFESVFYVAPRFIAASLIAYWCGEFTNSFVMAKMKIWSQGRHLWMRTIGSTVAGQAVDTVVIMTLAFAFTAPWRNIGELIVSGYIAKVLYEAAATPLTYLIVNGLKRAEGVDIYDTETDFSPFASEKQG